MTEVRQTSLMSYLQLRLENELGARQQLVFAYISTHPRCSDREISNEVGLPINCITGRRNELKKMGMIREDGEKYDEETDRMVLAWRTMQ